MLVIVPCLVLGSGLAVMLTIFGMLVWQGFNLKMGCLPELSIEKGTVLIWVPTIDYPNTFVSTVSIWVLRRKAYSFWYI